MKNNSIRWGTVAMNISNWGVLEIKEVENDCGRVHRQKEDNAVTEMKKVEIKNHWHGGQRERTIL